MVQLLLTIAVVWTAVAVAALVVLVPIMRSATRADGAAVTQHGLLADELAHAVPSARFARA